MALPVETPRNGIPLVRSNAARLPTAEDLSMVLVAADRLFYAGGIVPTTMREVAKASGISLGRLVRIYSSKEALVVAYLAARHQVDVRILERLRASELSPTQILESALDGIISDLLSPNFRGCPFLNAAAESGLEYPDVARHVREHRDWYTEQTTNLLRAAGHPHPADAADDLVLARDGGMASIHGGNVIAAVAAMRRAILRAYREIDMAAGTAVA